MSGANCDDAAAAVSSLAVDDKPETDREPAAASESVIDVPAEFANNFPLGFALDAGGSVTKLIYRSKHDYSAGKPNNGKDILRLRFFPNGDGTELIKFLQENCDVKTTSPDDCPLYYQTGVGVQHYQKKLEETFRCRIKLISEVDSLIAGVMTVPNQFPSFKASIPHSTKAVQQALSRVREFTEVLMSFQAAGMPLSGDPMSSTEAEFDIPAFVTKVMTIDPAQLAKELNSRSLEYPCIIVQCGSASMAALLSADGNYSGGDFNIVAGKTFLALGRALTGAQTFDELIELASTGNADNVTLSAGDVKNKAREEVDWYSLMPTDSPLFALGKMAESKYDGTYTKNDIAAGLLFIYCNDLARMAINQCRIFGARHVIFAGSAVQCPTARHVLEELFLVDSLQLAMSIGKSFFMHVLPHSAFHAAIGVWYENFKEYEAPQSPS